MTTDNEAIDRISTWQKFSVLSPVLIKEICNAYEREKGISRVLSRSVESAFEKQEGGNHYRNMKSQPFSFVRDNNVGHAEGEIIYRVLRWRNKGGIADLKKVIHTAELIIEYEEGRQS